MLIIGSTDEIREKLHKPGANMDAMFIDIVNQARAGRGGSPMKDNLRRIRL